MGLYVQQEVVFNMDFSSNHLHIYINQQTQKLGTLFILALGLQLSQAQALSKVQASSTSLHLLQSSNSLLSFNKEASPSNLYKTFKEDNKKFKLRINYGKVMS